MKENQSIAAQIDPNVRYRLLTKREAARLGSFSVRHLENLIHRKAIAVVRLGKRCVRIRPADLEACINKRRVKAIGERAI